MLVAMVAAPVATAEATTVTLAPDRTAPQAPGTTIRWTSSAGGGTAPYSFKWWLYDGVSWTVLRDWNQSPSFDWTPAVANSAYRVGVWVRSAGKTSDVDEANEGVNFAITTAAAAPAAGRATAVTLTADRLAPQPAGTTIKWTAQATGGVAPVSFKWWLYDGSSWAVLRDWSTSGSLAWTPAVPNSAYRVGVWVRSAGTSADVDEVNEGANFAITSAPSPSRVSALTLEPDRPSPQRVGTPVTWTAAPTGGTAPHSYKWWVYDGQRWTMVRDWSTSASYVWTPASTGLAYRVGVWVKSAGNASDVDESNLSVAFSITDPSRVSAVTIAPDKAAPQAAGSAITWTATAADGVAPLSYKWWIFDGQQWTAASSWSTSNVFTWTPARASEAYRVGVWARSATNQTEVDEANVSQPFAIGTTAAGCAQMLEPRVISVGSGGGSVSSRVTPSFDGCGWDVTSQASWIEVSSGSRGTGDGTVSLTVAPNAEVVSRTGTVIVGGRTLSITQAGASTAGGCTYAVFPTTLDAAFGNGTASVAVTAPAGCPWSASASGFTHLTPSSGSGSGTVTVTIENNTAVESRAAVLTIAGRAVTVTQEGRSTGNAAPPACTFDLSPSEVAVDFRGGNAAVSVQAPAGCAWSASAASEFVHLTGAASGYGGGTVALVVDANGTGAARSGLLRIAGRSVTITQRAPDLEPSCVYTLSAPSTGVSYAGGTISVAVTTAPGCEWDVTSRTGWLSITASSGPIGTGVVWIAVDHNSGSERAGTLVIAGQTFTVSQSAPPVTAAANEIRWASQPDGARVGDCAGNCGAGCGTFFNPCSGPHYWEHTVLSTPEYAGDDWEPICAGDASWFEVRPRYTALARWTYHGLRSPRCEAHDATCRALGFLPIPVDAALCLATAGLVGLTGPNYCDDARPYDWSYELVDVGHGPVVAYLDGAPSCN